jgi:hypothetical protein
MKRWSIRSRDESRWRCHYRRATSASPRARALPWLFAGQGACSLASSPHRAARSLRRTERHRTARRLERTPAALWVMLWPDETRKFSASAVPELPAGGPQSRDIGSTLIEGARGRRMGRAVHWFGGLDCGLPARSCCLGNRRSGTDRARSRVRARTASEPCPTRKGSISWSSSGTGAPPPRGCHTEALGKSGSLN